MGNQQSSHRALHPAAVEPPKLSSTSESQEDDKAKYKSFPGSAILEKTFCGSIDTTDPDEYKNESITNRLLRKADIMCVSSPISRRKEEESSSDSDQSWSGDDDDDDENSIVEEKKKKSTPQQKSARLLARALVSEVTDNPKTMKPAEMAAREKKLLRAQEAASKQGKRPVGLPGAGVGPPHVLGSLAFACTGDEAPVECVHPRDMGNQDRSGVATLDAFGQPTSSSQLSGMDLEEMVHEDNPFAVTIAVCMSRRTANVGNNDTITRQTAFDFNLLQDRSYKYVSATDKNGWRGGGGEPGGAASSTNDSSSPSSRSHGTFGGLQSPRAEGGPQAEKDATVDSVHIPILHLDCRNKQAVDQVIHSLASGDIFIPHMSVVPESLVSVQDNKTLPDLCLRFDCDRNDEDTHPDEWNNWCLEFMHNQLYEYFYPNPHTRPIWMPRPFSLTLARGVRWKTVKHMNRYFCNGDQVLAQWKEKGPQYLDPHPTYMEGGACPEEVARPHGIYLLRRNLQTGQIEPTNYFGPNFDPPYTTKMTRSLLENVLSKSWDMKRQEWASQPQTRLLSPTALFAAACGCSESGAGGFVANEVTRSKSFAHRSVAPPVFSPRRNTPTARPMKVASPVAIVPRQTQSPMRGQRVVVEAVSSDEEDDAFAETLKQAKQEESNQDLLRADESGMNFSIASPNEEERPMSVAASGFMSVAASGTTVAAANTVATVQNLTSHTKTNGKQLYSDEDWSQTSSTIPTHKMVDAGRYLPNTNDSPASSTNRSSSTTDPPGNKGSPLWSKKKKKTTEKPPQNDKRDRKTHYRMQAVDNVKRSIHSGSPKEAAMPSVDDPKDSESGVSLEYSVDGSASLFTTNDASTLLGQHYAADADSMSISTIGQKQQQQQQKNVSPTISKQHSKPLLVSGNIKVVPDEPVVADTEDETVDEDESILTVVPTDEELFAIGWAKALDKASGNYYYFTLDRTKTVWENPIGAPVDAPASN